jgi:fluoride exporter
MASSQLQAVLWVALGGALGAVCRYLAGAAAVRATDHLWLGTFVVNIFGCLVLGFLVGYWQADPPFVGLFALMIGFLGSFTTFSTFAVDTLRLSGPGSLANVMGQVVLGVGAAWVGMRLGGLLSTS